MYQYNNTSVTIFTNRKIGKMLHWHIYKLIKINYLRLFKAVSSFGSITLISSTANPPTEARNHGSDLSSRMLRMALKQHQLH